MNSLKTCPAQRSELIVTEVEGEALIYDGVAHRAHAISADCHQVFRRCDGRTSIAAIVAELTRRPRQGAAGEAGRSGAPLSEERVWQALTELSHCGLLAAPVRPNVDLARRRVLKRAALTAGVAAALPMVWSIVAPTVADAASLPPVACAACQSAGQCCGPSGTKARTCLPNGSGGFSCTGPSTGQCNSICQ